MTGVEPRRSVVVIVPACNEQSLLPAALDAIGTAARHPALESVRVVTVVAADSCTDGTAAIARSAGALVVPVRYRNVGRARAAAVAAGLATLPAAGAGSAWIASTDADSRVPADWLAFHLARAEEGWEALVGTVAVDRWPPHSRNLAVRYHRLYEASRPPAGHRGPRDQGRTGWQHPHVHGANLGCSAGAYAAAGGFPPLPLDEDHGLVAALERAGARILRTPDCPVTTSSRLRPRARGGFGDHLARLDSLDRVDRPAKIVGEPEEAGEAAG
ncbi:glycosyltransferase [Streptomyces sp. NPDC091272]|uniref:glycosyltransferase n=1 Tax=Streptomyces sp. NPDC091272 TaxID=3365981 RepID=UPI003830542A